jgi:hypothetical protein
MFYLVKQRAWMRGVEVLERLRSAITPDVYNRVRVLLIEERIKEKFAEDDVSLYYLFIQICFCLEVGRSEASETRISQ